jgi:hypothetical protein
MSRGRGQHLAAVDGSPDRMGDLPRYFAALDAEVLRRSWVACVVLCAAERDTWAVDDLARALAVVRDRMAGRTPTIDDGPSERPRRRPGWRAGEARPEMRGALWGEVEADLLAALPQVGDRVTLAEVYPGTDGTLRRAKARPVAQQHPDLRYVSRGQGKAAQVEGVGVGS